MYPTGRHGGGRVWGSYKVWSAGMGQKRWSGVGRPETCFLSLCFFVDSQAALKTSDIDHLIPEASNCLSFIGINS